MKRNKQQTFPNKESFDLKCICVRTYVQRKLTVGIRVYKCVEVIHPPRFSFSPHILFTPNNRMWFWVDMRSLRFKRAQSNNACLSGQITLKPLAGCTHIDTVQLWDFYIHTTTSSCLAHYYRAPPRLRLMTLYYLCSHKGIRFYRACNWQNSENLCLLETILLRRDARVIFPLGFYESILVTMYR